MLRSFAANKLAWVLQHRMRLSFRLSLVAALFICLLLLLIRFRLNEAPSTWHTEEKIVRGSRDKDVEKPVATESIPAPSLNVVTSSIKDVGLEPTPSTTGVPEKVIVMARLEKEQTDWVAEELADWDHAIYTVDNPDAKLHVPVNKGKEAMTYLTYIIEHYYTLPEILVFIHSHRDGYPTAWHTDVDGYSNVLSVRSLKLDFVRRTGFANLRCNWIPGCPDEMQPFRHEEHRTAEHELEQVWKHMFHNTSVPRQIGAACCAQFAVSREQVLARPWTDYQRFRQWLLDTELEDEISGRIFEYLWHIIFGRDPVYCPELQQCRCDVYGEC